MVKIKDLKKLAQQHNISLDSDEFREIEIEFKSANSKEQQSIYDDFLTTLSAPKKPVDTQTTAEEIVAAPPPEEHQAQRPEQEAEQEAETADSKPAAPVVQSPTRLSKPKKDNKEKTDEQFPEIRIYDTPEEIGRPNPKEKRFSFLSSNFKEEVLEALNNNPNIDYNKLMFEIASIASLPPNKQKAAIEAVRKKYLIKKQNKEKAAINKAKKTIEKTEPKPMPNPIKKEKNDMTDKTKDNQLFKEELAKWQQENPSVTDISPELQQQLENHFKNHGNSLKDFKYEAPQPTATRTAAPRGNSRPQEPKKVTLHQKAPDDSVPHKKGLEGFVEHWQKWCADEENKNNLKRTLTPIDTDKGVKFDIKETGDKVTTVHAISEESVAMPLSDYAYFDELAKSLKDTLDAEVLVLGEDIDDPKYFNRAIAAAYANGLEVENYPPNLDLREEALEGIPAKALETLLQKQVFDRTREIEFDTLKQALERNYYLQKSMLPADEKPTINMENMEFKNGYEKNRAVVAMLNQGYKIENIGRLDFSFEQIEGFRDEEIALLSQNIDYEKQSYDDYKNMLYWLPESEKTEPIDVSDEKDKISPHAMNSLIAAIHAQGFEIKGLDQLDLSAEATAGLPPEARTDLAKINVSIVKRQLDNLSSLKKGLLRPQAETNPTPQPVQNHAETTPLPQPEQKTEQNYNDAFKTMLAKGFDR